MKRILIVLFSMLLLSSVCFAEGDDDYSLNYKEQYVYDCVNQIEFNEPESVRFRCVSDPFDEKFCIITVSFRNYLGGTSLQKMIFEDKRLQDAWISDGYDASDPDINLKKLNHVWKANHQDD